MAKKTITYHDNETKRILSEFFEVCYNRVEKTRTTQSAIRAKKKTVNEYSKLIDKWVKQKSKSIYHLSC